jgi:hypothetical protein
MRLQCESAAAFFCYPNEGNMAISKNTYYGKQNVPSVRKNYGHSFRVEPRRSGAKLARSQEILQYEFA